MLSAEQIMNAYVAAWNAQDAGTRLDLLQQSMAEDAIIAYPSLEARGWEDISAILASVQQRIPGAKIIRTSGVEEYHGWLRAAWRMLKADGSLLLDGEDVAEMASDGRLGRVIGFHDPLPPPEIA